jgi:MFS family permease
MAYFSWHSIFFFMVPFCSFGLLASILVLKHEAPRLGDDRRIDWGGSALFALAIGLLTTAISFSATWGFLSVKFIICLSTCVASFFFFVRWEDRTALPLVKLEFFKNPAFALANFSSVCLYTLVQMAIFIVPFFLIDILLVSESASGIVMLATPLAMMLTASTGGKLTDKYGSRRPAIIGLGVIVGGCMLMTAATVEAPLVIVVLAMLLLGVGQGLSVIAINAAIFAPVPKEYTGVASGLVATMRNLGNGLGVAFGSAIMVIRQNHYMSRGSSWGTEILADNQIYMLAQRDTFYFGTLVVLAAMLCMSRTGDRRQTNSQVNR